MEWVDFQNIWEQRLLALARPYLDPKPQMLEGSAVAEFADGSVLAVVVTPQEESPPHSGFWDCDILVQYEYERTDQPEEVSRTWGQILMGFGEGINGEDKLIDRLRFEPGRTVIPGGIDAVRYDRPIQSDTGQIKEFQFSAHLGLVGDPAPV